VVRPGEGAARREPDRPAEAVGCFDGDFFEGGCFDGDFLDGDFSDGEFSGGTVDLGEDR